MTVCPGANLAGDVIVGDGVWVGINACAVQGVTIGEWSFIGAGSVVVKDIPPRVLAYGNPCRVIRELKPEELGRIL